MSFELERQEHCGVIATIGTSIKPSCFTDGWSSLKNRGSDAWGLLTVTQDGQLLEHAKHFSAIPSIQYDARIRVGHNRYATSGGGSLQNAQPFLFSSGEYSLGLAHNGNIPDAVVTQLRTFLLEPPPATASDSYIMAKFLLESRSLYPTWDATFLAVLPLFRGAFSLICLTEENAVYAIRDKWGIRPLSLGKKEGSWIVSSESIVFTVMEAQHLRELKPGEMVRLAVGSDPVSFQYARSKKERFCLLESVYFANNQSTRHGRTIRAERKALGRAAARRFLSKRIPIDMVIPVLNSGKQMSMGVSEVLQMDNIEAIRVATNERSFIQNTPESRRQVVHAKHVVDGAAIQGKKLLLCDDSLVRGTSLEALLEKIREHNPGEIHILLGSEPVIDICNLGVDLPTKEELLVPRLKLGRPDFDDMTSYFEWLSSVELKVAKELGIQSITYLDRYSVNTAMKRKDDQMCRHCFGGEYPISEPSHLTHLPSSDRLQTI